MHTSMAANPDTVLSAVTLTEERAHVETVARVRAIDEDAFQKAYAEGSCASLDQIVDRARSHGGQA